MKAIMYHYVRPDQPDLPYFKYLHLEDFAKQLEYFGDKYGFISKKDFFNSLNTAMPVKGVILTFDDGLKDHYRYVLPELQKRNLWSIFYIPTYPLMTGKWLSVHRIHMLLGRYDGEIIADALKSLVTDEMLSHEHIKEFHTETYNPQNNNDSTNYVKRVLNYFIDYKYRQNVLDSLMDTFCGNALVEEFYMTRDEIVHMQYWGMVVGSHSVHHSVMSKLTLLEQEKEIQASFQTIEEITGELAIRTFCYPYGGFYSFTVETEQLLTNHSCRFSFNVEQRDIESSDLISRRQALPRYDCNEFPFGCCRHSY